MVRMPIGACGLARIGPNHTTTNRQCNRCQSGAPLSPVFMLQPSPKRINQHFSVSYFLATYFLSTSLISSADMTTSRSTHGQPQSSIPQPSERHWPTTNRDGLRYDFWAMELCGPPCGVCYEDFQYLKLVDEMVQRARRARAQEAARRSNEQDALVRGASNHTDTPERSIQDQVIDEWIAATSAQAAVDKHGFLHGLHDTATPSRRDAVIEEYRAKVTGLVQKATEKYFQNLPAHDEETLRAWEEAMIFCGIHPTEESTKPTPPVPSHANSEFACCQAANLDICDS
ncbi:hypothetical protein C8Q74DRAFT_992567 [Fomes fomentarius]|nr:hypothetical protein C8Q74DRAFT_992567 [Fomes fomentarius]